MKDRFFCRRNLVCLEACSECDVHGECIICTSFGDHGKCTISQLDESLDQLDEMKRRINQAYWVPWAPDLPLKAAGWVGYYFTKD